MHRLLPRSRHGSCTSALSIAALLALAACGEDDDPALSQSGAPSTMFTPPPVIDDDEFGEPAVSSRNDPWSPCTNNEQCLPNEQCILGVPEPFNICLASCNDVDDCVAPSIPSRTDFTAFITCSELQGARRCVLGCVTTSQCIAGMTCQSGFCVWR